VCRVKTFATTPLESEQLNGNNSKEGEMDHDGKADVQKFWFENWQFVAELNKEHPLFFDLLQWALTNNITFKQFVSLGTILDKRLKADRW
jgi:hypothetical protein